MYKHILLATDGSDLARHAVNHGLQLAKAVGAATTAVTVSLPWSAVAYGDMAVAIPPDDYDASTAEAAAKTLADVTAAAEKIGTTCKVIHVSDLSPYDAILRTAKDENCDLIVVGSHGRSGISRLLLGSETVKILSHTHIPVLVWRE